MFIVLPLQLLIHGGYQNLQRSHLKPTILYGHESRTFRVQARNICVTGLISSTIGACARH